VLISDDSETSATLHSLCSLKESYGTRNAEGGDPLDCHSKEIYINGEVQVCKQSVDYNEVHLKEIIAPQPYYPKKR